MLTRCIMTILPLLYGIAFAKIEIKECWRAVISQCSSRISQYADAYFIFSTDGKFTTITIYITTVVEQSVSLKIQHTPAQSIIRSCLFNMLSEVSVFGRRFDN